MVSKQARDRGLVYSTELGRCCPQCGQAASACGCRSNPAPPTGDGVVRVGRATKGRKGAGVTVVTGLSLDPTELRTLAATLKKRCGAGGAVKDGVIEIQGEHRDTLMTILQQLGYRVKRSGG